MRPPNSKNKSFYHYFVQEFDEETLQLSKPEFFYTAKEITEKYNISRQTIYRLINGEKSNFPHYIERTHIHNSVEWII